MSGEALGVDAILRRADILHEYKENVAVQHVVFGFRDLALLLHNTPSPWSKGDVVPLG